MEMFWFRCGEGIVWFLSLVLGAGCGVLVFGLFTEIAKGE